MQPDRGERCRGRAGIIRPENQLQHQQARHQLPRHGDVQDLQPESEHQQPDQAERVHADKVCRWLPGQFRADFFRANPVFLQRARKPDRYFKSGVAKSKEFNKAWRQGSTMAAVLGQFIADKTGQDVLDDGNLTTLGTNFKNALDKNTIEGFASLLSAKGYQKLPSGLTIQWGSEYSDDQSMLINYLQPYSIATFFASATKITSGDGRFATVGNPSKNGFTASGRLGNTPVALNNFMWFAIGV